LRFLRHHNIPCFGMHHGRIQVSNATLPRVSLFDGVNNSWMQRLLDDALKAHRRKTAVILVDLRSLFTLFPVHTCTCCRFKLPRSLLNTCGNLFLSQIICSYAPKDLIPSKVRPLPTRTLSTRRELLFPCSIYSSSMKCTRPLMDMQLGSPIPTIRI
jgi:hypothetical protein